MKSPQSGKTETSHPNGGGRFGGDEFVWRLPVAAYRSTPEGKFIAGNRALMDLLGVADFDELQALNIRDLYKDPEARDRMKVRVAAGQVIPPEDVELRKLDSSAFWARVTSVGVYGEDGTVSYYEGVVQDVTDQRASTAQLAESNRLLDTLTNVQNRYISGTDPRQVFDELLDDLLGLTRSQFGFIARLVEDEQGEFLRTLAISNIAWNEETRKQHEAQGGRIEFRNLDTLFGRAVTTGMPVISHDPAADSVGRPSSADHPPIHSFLALPIIQGGSVIGMVAVANRPGGYQEELAADLKPFLATVGGLIQVVLADRARTEAEDRERVREQHFRAVVDAAVDAVVVFDADGVIQSFNPAAEQMFGFSAEDSVGRNIRRLLPDRLSAGIEDLLFVDGAERTARELVLQHRSGDEIPVESSFGRAVLDGRTITTAVLRDVTERKVTEAALERAKVLAEKASKAKGQFLAAMSHELRTPLNGIIGLSSLLMRGTHGEVTEQQRDYLTHIESSGRHLLEVINDVLDLAKIEEDRFEPDLGPVEVPAVIEESIAMMRESIVSKSLRVKTSVDENIPVIAADARRTKQVVLNLLSNAVKFTEPGGTIGAEAVVDEGCVRITVWDTGVGIPPEQLDAVFEPFHQAESTLARRHEGIGLGLALSRRLVEMQGGVLSATSRPGEGSRFEFRLPLGTPVDETEAVPPAPQLRATADPAGGRRRVLVVEDNEINRMLIVDYLQAHGVEVLVAGDGDEAVAQAVKHMPDAILMDIQMPRRDGLSATRELKGRDDTKHIPVVALTALAMSGDAERCLAAGCDGYLSKPCDPATVHATLLELSQ